MTIVRLTRRRLTQAVAALSAQDPKMAVAIERVGPCTMLPRTDGTHFDHLARVVPFVGGLGDVQAFIALQPHQPPAEGAGQHLGDLGFADTGFALKKQRSAHAQRQKHRSGQTALGDIVGACQQGHGGIDALRQGGIKGVALGIDRSGFDGALGV